MQEICSICGSELDEEYDVYYIVEDNIVCEWCEFGRRLGVKYKKKKKMLTEEENMCTLEELADFGAFTDEGIYPRNDYSLESYEVEEMMKYIDELHVIGSILNQVREKLGLSVDEMSEQTSIKVENILKIEQGEVIQDCYGQDEVDIRRKIREYLAEKCCEKGLMRDDEMKEFLPWDKRNNNVISNNGLPF